MDPICLINLVFAAALGGERMLRRFERYLYEREIPQQRGDHDVNPVVSSLAPPPTPPPPTPPPPTAHLELQAKDRARHGLSVVS